jgi:hypothetical protein
MSNRLKHLVQYSRTGTACTGTGTVPYGTGTMIYILVPVPVRYSYRYRYRTVPVPYVYRTVNHCRSTARYRYGSTGTSTTGSADQWYYVLPVLYVVLLDLATVVVLGRASAGTGTTVLQL